MDSDGVEEEENVPKIMSPEIHDVFHVFASMLNVKSFMKLAMTSKEMYERCMESKAIRISVDVAKVTARNGRRSVEIGIASDISPDTLRKLPCDLNLRTLLIQSEHKLPGVSVESKIQRYLKMMGVKSIHNLQLTNYITEWETIISIIKEFRVRSVNIDYSIWRGRDILRSILQLNLEKLRYAGSVPVGLILDVDSSIKEISFTSARCISKDELVGISSKIHSGSLNRLTVNSRDFEWNTFDTWPIDREEPVPDDRPLIISRTPRSGNDEYWLLHWNGDVTKCITHNVKRFQSTMEISKCEPLELPYILRKEEDVLKDLAGKRSMVSCSANQFRIFSTSFATVDLSHEGPLPEDRPLYFKTPQVFWMLGKDDNLMNCTWEDGCATWNTLEPRGFGHIEHPALVNHLFWKMIMEVKPQSKFTTSFRGIDDFYSSLKNLVVLDFEFCGDLPSARPLIFKKTSSKSNNNGVLVVLLDDDRLVQCEFSQGMAVVEHCSRLNGPSVLFTVADIVHMLKGGCIRDIVLNMSFESFCDVRTLLKESILAHQNQNWLLTSEKTDTEFWYRNDADISKVEWKDGRISVSKADLRHSPPLFMKQAFRYFAETFCRTSLTIYVEQFRYCLEQFTIVPFDYSGPLTTDAPIAFVKNEIRHSCQEGATCQCSEVAFIFVWFLWDALHMTKCSWGNYSRANFGIYTFDFFEVPLFLKSKEYLKILLQAEYSQTSRFDWFGSLEDLIACLNDYAKFPFDFIGRLPEERPILFHDYNNLLCCFTRCFLLRADGTVIKCVSLEPYVSLCLFSCTGEVIPGVLREYVI